MTICCEVLAAINVRYIDNITLIPPPLWTVFVVQVLSVCLLAIASATLVILASQQPRPYGQRGSFFDTPPGCRQAIADDDSGADSSETLPDHYTTTHCDKLSDTMDHKLNSTGNQKYETEKSTSGKPHGQTYYRDSGGECGSGEVRK